MYVLLQYLRQTSEWHLLGLNSISVQNNGDYKHFTYQCVLKRITICLTGIGKYCITEQLDSIYCNRRSYLDVILPTILGLLNNLEFVFAV